MNKFVALQFLLDAGPIMQAIMPEHEAKSLITEWANKRLAGIIGGSNQHGTWGVQVEHIIGMHLVPFPEQGQLPVSHGVWQPGASGI